MAAATAKRAEVVAENETTGQELRGVLEGLNYSVGLKGQVEPEADQDRFARADVIIYDVSSAAARAERRRVVRPEAVRRTGTLQFWLEALHHLSVSAPLVPILVTLPAGVEAADAALASGATDVLQGGFTRNLIRRRLEMLEAFSRTSSLAGRPRRAAGRGALALPLPALRSSASGRIDAQKVAEYLGVPLRQLAAAIGLPYAGVHKTPDAVRIQQPLAPFARILELAEGAFGAPEPVRMWLNRPLYELENDSPLAVMLAGEAGAVETLLANARAGIPG
jgi:uncharacterized protein (DUF2384 family)